MTVLGAWASPVVLATLLGRIIAGDGAAPLLAVAVVVAPLVALLAGRAPHVAPHAARPTDVTAVAAASLVLVANLIVLGDLARALGADASHGIVIGALMAVGALAWPRQRRWRRFVTPLGALLVVAPIGLVVAVMGPPWTVWSALASRPALTFDANSPWVTTGHTFSARTRLTFDEPHRLVAAAPSTWRVIERDAPSAVVREWTLGAGDALTLRPGDELALEAGARVRFEAGRRVPGSPVSGIAWANGRPSPALFPPLAALGLVVTLIGGALGLAHGRAGGAVVTRQRGPGRALRAALSAASVPSIVLVFVAAAVAWGLYGTAVAPEVVMAPSALVSLAEVMPRLFPAWGPFPGAAAIGGLMLLFFGFVLTWPSQPAALLRAATGEAQTGSAARVGGATAALVVGAAMLALRGGDPWQWFVWALGLAASAVAAPRLATTGRRGEFVGALVGGAAFVTALVAPDAIPVGLPAVREHPALLAAPLGWAAARLVHVGAARRLPARRRAPATLRETASRSSPATPTRS